MRVMVMCSVVSVIALLGSGCTAVEEATSSGPDYSGEDLATDVVSAVNRNAKQYGYGARVESADCEDIETVEKDAIADCTVTTRNGKDFYVRVTFQDDEGHFMVNAV